MEEVLVEWGGEKFSQEPKQYTFKSSVRFEEYKNTNYYERIVGKK